MVRAACVSDEGASTALTHRQAQIHSLVAKGLADKEIADKLGISEETVAHHLRVMFDRAGVHCRAALVAAQRRLLPGP